MAASSSFERIPVLEMSEREEVWSGGQQHKMYQAYKGQLKLSAYMNYGLLTVHVMQARHVTSKWKKSCDSYVKMSLVPDHSRRTRCKTEVIYDSNSPTFDQKFSFELVEGDERKRLLISMWHRDVDNNRTELLGCMSFGVHHLRTGHKVVNGWYYLLGEDVGRRKHMEVQDDARSSLNESRQQLNITSVNKDVLWMDSHTLVLKRNSSGFGFSVTGTCPVQVCKVEENSAASAAGLQRGDCIIRINGQNVSRSTSDSVARIVRHASRRVLLEIQRPKMLAYGSVGDHASWQPLSSTLLSESSDSDSEDEGSPLTLEDLCSLDDLSGSRTLSNSMKRPPSKKKVSWGPNRWLQHMR